MLTKVKNIPFENEWVTNSQNSYEQSNNCFLKKKKKKIGEHFTLKECYHKETSCLYMFDDISGIELYIYKQDIISWRLLKFCLKAYVVLIVFSLSVFFFFFWLFFLKGAEKMGT